MKGDDRKAAIARYKERKSVAEFARFAVPRSGESLALLRERLAHWRSMLKAEVI